MKTWLASLLLVTALITGSAPRTPADWRTAEPGWQYEFPRDHHAHRDFRTEWWYFTGTLFNAEGRRFGYELTFFRQGIRAPEQRDPTLSRFVVDDLKFAHFTVTDVAGQRFRFEQKTSRGAFGESGFDDGERVAWIENWNLVMNPDGSFDLGADSSELAVRFHLQPQSVPVIHGEGGISAKASGNGHASHYYSIPRLETAGNLRVGAKTFPVRGVSWFDHEWATNQLAQEQIGWNWLSVQWDDGTALMIYQMRFSNGTSDPASSGTFVRADGSTVHLPSSAFKMTPVRQWKSKSTGANYPVEWRIEIPEQQMQFIVRTVLDDQELALNPLTYWEGAIDAIGSRGGRPVSGRGYLELTGYAGPLRELTKQ